MLTPVEGTTSRPSILAPAFRRVLHAAAMLLGVVSAAGAAQRPAPRALVPVPAPLADDAREIYRMALFGAYQIAFDFPSGMTDEQLKGFPRDGFLPTAGETTPLVYEGDACKEPDTPDPNYKPTNTGDYWMHAFADKHIDHPASEEETYQKMMVEFRRLCHTRWNLALLLRGMTPPLLAEEQQRQPEASCRAGVAPAPGSYLERTCTRLAEEADLRSKQGSSLDKLVNASMSTIVFSPDRSIALLYLYINKGAFSDTGMWEGFRRVDGEWKFASDWSRRVTVHD